MSLVDRVPQNSASQTMYPLRILLNEDSGSDSLGRGLRFCISNKLQSLHQLLVQGQDSLEKSNSSKLRWKEAAAQMLLLAGERWGARTNT